MLRREFRGNVHRLDRDFQPPTCFPHRLHRVRKQVHEYLMELGTVPKNKGESFPKVGFDFDDGRCRVPNELQCFLSDVGQPNRPAFGVLPIAKHRDLTNQIAGTLRCLNNLATEACYGSVRRGSPNHLCKPQDSGQNIVEVVGHSSRELP